VHKTRPAAPTLLLLLLLHVATSSEGLDGLLRRRDLSTRRNSESSVHHEG
jgi:hypothetical protein